MREDNKAFMDLPMTELPSNNSSKEECLRQFQSRQKLRLTREQILARSGHTQKADFLSAGNQPKKTKTMKVIIYKAKETEWIVIISPDTPQESEVATCKTQELAEALCKGMEWEYTVTA